MTRIPKSGARGTGPQPTPVPVRTKLDPRLSFLLSLPRSRLRTLKNEEDRKLRLVVSQYQSVLAALEQQTGAPATPENETRLQELENRLFAPITAGVYLPSRGESPWPIRMREPHFSAFILSDANARDLSRLGVKVRNQAGDVFTGFIPASAIGKLEASVAIRFIELARPFFPSLNQAVPYTQINALQSAMPPIMGTGVIVGLSDTILDIYHPDFRTAAGATRVLFLWDQTLAPQAGEAGPPTAPTLPGFMPVGGSYGVEYNQATIDAELTSFNPPAVPAYQTVRHGGASAAHGTHVAGIAAGNGLGQAGTFTGGAPGASIIFVANPGLQNTGLLSDSTFVADAFSYIFARAALLGQPCVINMSNSDNQGPHDGMTLGEQFLDNLLLIPGRVITLSAGNSNGTAAHAAGSVTGGGTTNVVLNYGPGAANSDDVEIWYDRQDRFSVTVTAPTAPATVIGPVAPGAATAAALPGGVSVQVTSVLNDARNGDNLISIIITVPAGGTIPAGNWTIALAGTTVVNGSFQAWVDRNNRPLSAWQAPFLQENTLTLGVPATARRAITVGNHNKTGPPPAISGSSGRGPTRDGRIKPEIATVGSNVTAPASRNMNAAMPGALYVSFSGTSMSAPLVAGACALLFQCRGGSPSWAQLKQILEDTAGTAGLVPAPPNPAFGFGFMQMATACARPALNVDVWLRDDSSDAGVEPFTGPVAWLSPDIEVLDTAGNPVANPTYNPANRFNNIVRVTVRNRGAQMARNTEVYLYWGDPATNLPYPSAWNNGGIFTGAPAFLTGGNLLVIPQLAGGASTQVQFAWAPPAPGSNIRGDDHFCLMVRLENEADPSQIGMGGWASITARNNIALHNLHVQVPSGDGDAAMPFYVVGSADQDSLVVYPELAGGQVTLALPVRALPWREIQLIERHGGRRLPYGCGDAADPLADAVARLRSEAARLQTGVEGAERLDLRGGVATILVGGKGPLYVPDVRLVEGTKLTAAIRVRSAKISAQQRYVHVAQLSGGQLIGGVSLELRPKGRNAQ